MTAGTEETNGREPSAEVCVTETEIGAEDRVRKLEDCVTSDEDCCEFHKLTLIKVFYSLNTASCTCTKDVTLSIQCTCTLKNCLLLQKTTKNGRLALPCALRSHDYLVTGSANESADMQIKYKTKEK